MIKKKIIISNYDDVKNPDYAGGGAVVIKRVAKYFSKKYDVTLVTGKYPGSKNEIIDGVKYRRIGSYIFGGKFGHLFYLFALPFESLRQRCDLWIDSFTPPFSVSFVPILLGKSKVVGMVHMLSGKDMRRKYILPFDIVERLGLRLYKHFIVLTEESKKEILKSNPKAEISVIPNGIDIPSEKYLKVKKKPQILFLGRIEVNQKGLDLLIPAYAKVLKSIKNVNLIIAGTGSINELQKLNVLIDRYNLNNKIKLIGRIDGKNKIKLLRESQIMVVPSRFETFGITALEALSNKTALVCFDIQGLKWLPKRVAYKITPFSVKKLSQGLIDLYNNPELGSNKVEDGFKYSTNFTWKDVLLKYDEVINKHLK